MFVKYECFCLFSVRLQTKKAVKKLRGFQPMSIPSEFTWGYFIQISERNPLNCTALM